MDILIRSYTVLVSQETILHVHGVLVHEDREHLLITMYIYRMIFEVYGPN